MSKAASKSPQRLRLIKLIHVAARDLNMHDDAYLTLLRREGGKDSSADMDLAALDRVLLRMRELGWSPKPPKRKYSPPSRQKPIGQKTQADKIRAMWISLHRAGVVKNPSETSLGKFCKRLTGKHTPDWLNHDDAVIVIQALKAWAMRERVEDAVQI